MAAVWQRHAGRHRTRLRPRACLCSVFASPVGAERSGAARKCVSSISGTALGRLFASSFLRRALAHCSGKVAPSLEPQLEQGRVKVQAVLALASCALRGCVQPGSARARCLLQRCFLRGSWLQLRQALLAVLQAGHEGGQLWRSSSAQSQGVRSVFLVLPLNRCFRLCSGPGSRLGRSAFVLVAPLALRTCSVLSARLVLGSVSSSFSKSMSFSTSCSARAWRACAAAPPWAFVPPHPGLTPWAWPLWPPQPGAASSSPQEGASSRRAASASR